MYTGHLALGVAIKSRFPKVPTAPIILGAGFIDILDGLFVVAGINQVRLNLASGPYLYTDLNFIDWDHSLLMAIIWSLLWGAVFIKNKKVAVIAAFSVFAHFIIDVPVHNNDLALYPYSTIHLGFGLWGTLGIYSWLLEGVFCAILLGYAWRASTIGDARLLWCALLIAVLFFQLSPWLSPVKWLAYVNEPYAHMLMGILTTTGFLVPCLLLTWFINRAEKN